MPMCITLAEMPESEKKSYGVPSRITESTLNAFKRIAAAQRRSLSETIRIALEDYAVANDPEVKPSKPRR